MIGFLTELREKGLSTDPRVRYLAREKGLRYWTNFSLLVAIFCAVLAAWAHGGHWSVSLAAFGAALGLGGVLGFLFGVPASRGSVTTITNAGTVAVGTGDQSTTRGGAVDQGAGEGQGVGAGQAKDQANVAGNSRLPGDGPPASRASNLEQVADWVTKLLLGGSLTQLQKIPPMVWKWSMLVAIGIAGQPSSADLWQHQAFAAGLLVYGFILGFFSGFLITKLQLGKSVWD